MTSEKPFRRGVRATSGPTVAAAGFAALLLAACQADQADKVSIEEAKKITAAFAGASFVAPPRTIADITAILDREKQADPAAAAKARAAAAREPPPGASDAVLARFFLERGEAAGRIGDVKRQIADLKEAARLSQALDAGARADILFRVGMAESWAGYYADSIRNREQAIALAPPQKAGDVLSWSAWIAQQYALVGDLENADRKIANAERLLAEARTWGRGIYWSDWGDVWTSYVELAKAVLAGSRGRTAEAEALYRSAHAVMDRVPAGRTRFKETTLELTEVFLASNLVRQGRLAEAEVWARKSLTSVLSRLGRYSPETAVPARILAWVLRAQGRAAEAEQLYRAVVDIYRQTGVLEDSLGITRTRRDLAQTLSEQGRWAEALVEFEAIRSALAGDPRTLDQELSFAGTAWAAALLEAGRAGEALPLARKAVERLMAMVGEKHALTARAQGVLAIALARQEQTKEALAVFRSAVPILLSRSRQAEDDSASGSAKARELRSTLLAYVELLSDIRGTPLEREAGLDAAAESFRVADAARGRTVQQALAASAARATVRVPELADLARREQDAEKQIAALYTLLAEMMALPTDQRPAGKTEVLRTQIDQLRTARAALAEEIEKRFPTYADLTNPKLATVGEAQAALRPGEALVATLVGDSRSFVWLVPKEGSVEFAAVPLGREKIAELVGLMRNALEPNAATLGDIPDFDLESGYALYAALLKPVERGLKAANSLLVVADGPLGSLPLALMPTRPVRLAAAREPLFANYRDVPWLARTHAVTSLPSVSALATLRGIARASDRKREPFVGFGDPTFADRPPAAKTAPSGPVAEAMRGAKGAPLLLRSVFKTRAADNSVELASLPPLPDTAEEVRRIALALNADPSKSVFTGKAASEGRVKSMDLSGVRVIAFATHGLVPGDLNGLTQPALALSSPKATGEDGDGLLTMEEILALRLDADWVVLSACNTATGEGTGAEAISGLGRAFFYAGARALLASNWPVHSEATTALTTTLFRLQAENPHLGRAEALRRAQLWMIDQGVFKDAEGREVFAYAHPIFWAPFSLIGDGGGGAPGS